MFIQLFTLSFPADYPQIIRTNCAIEMTHLVNSEGFVSIFFHRKTLFLNEL